MSEFKKDDVFQAFFGAGLEGDYNFLEDDLKLIAEAYAEEGARQERAGCIKVVTQLNRVVGEKLTEVRGK
jgi:hypothetical protein